MPEENLYRKKTILASSLFGLTAIFTQRQLFLSMAKRDLRARYRNTSLGWIWSLIRPLISLFVYMLVVGKILGASKGTQDFGLFVFSGFLAYTLFVSFSIGSMKSVIENADLIKKINFPRIFLPLCAGVVACADALLNFLVLLVGYSLYGAWPSLHQLALLPIAFLVVIFLGLAVGMWGAVINVKYRDFGYLFETVINLGIWLTPMLYGYSFVLNAFKENALYLWLYLANPMANVVIEFQRALWPPAADPEIANQLFPGQLGLRLLVLLFVSAFLFLIASGYFVRKSQKFSETL
jgi:ABC-2 type transport system permease protein